MQAQVPFRRTDGDVTFLPGANSVAHPAQLPPGQYPRSMNSVNRGGVVQCRPGHRCKFVTPPGNFQGGEWFFPKLGTPVIIFGVEGLLYVSEFPYLTYRQILDVAFLPHARQLFFKQVEQSIERNVDGSLTFISPRNLLVIQDGGFTPPVVYDGTTAEHQRGAGLIPLGSSMEWVGDRLWVAAESKLYPSDLANPLSFTEYLTIVSPQFFILPGEITAMTKTTSVTSPQLLVFTNSTGTLFQASLRDRSRWLSTPNFQFEVLKTIGCTSQRSIVAHFGMLWWWSAYGLISFDAASQTYISSALPHRDAEMSDSKSRLSEDLAGVACIPVENYLLVSVPHADLYNKHTWVMDNGAYQTIDKMAPPAWNSVWTGTRPVNWLSASINDTNLVLHFSYDFDGNTRLWESFTPDRLDDRCPITWYLETRGYFVQDVTGRKQFRFADVFLSELSGVIDVAVFWAGAERGKYKRILTKRIIATTGTIRASDIVTPESIVFALKKQSRRIRTQDAKEILEGENQSSCDVESEQSEYIDEAFQLLIVVSGPGAVKAVAIFTDPEEGQKLGGACEEDETEDNIVRFDGAASPDDFLDGVQELSIDQLIFRSSKTVTLTSGGLIETGIGEAESTISQQAADKIAECIALRKAAKRLTEDSPEIISQGEA
jgi:hypothetical protein